jgi:hypothetical protein
MDVWDSLNPWVQIGTVIYLILGIIYSLEKVLKKEYRIISLADFFLLFMLVICWFPFLVYLVHYEHKKH